MTFQQHVATPAAKVAPAALLARRVPGASLPKQTKMQRGSYSELQTNRLWHRKTIMAVAAPDISAAPSHQQQLKLPRVSETITQVQVNLPDFTEERAQAVLTDYGQHTFSTKDAREVFAESRPSTATLLFPADLPRKAGSRPVPVVIFGHGFTQPPGNYQSTLEDIATKEGAIVIAPDTGFCDSLGKVAGAGPRAKPPTKMQAALIVDVLRSASFLFPPPGTQLPESLKGLRPGSVSLVGHSMGAGVALVTASFIKEVVGVAVEAPAVKQMSKSPVNPDIYLDGLFGKGYARAKKYFTGWTEGDAWFGFPKRARLHILGANQDQIVPPLEVAELFAAAREAVKQGDATGVRDVTLFRVNGSHIGFEDKVSLEFTNPLLTAVFNIINLIVYRAEFLKPLLQDFSDQKEAAQLVLTGSLREFFTDGREPFPTKKEESQLGVYDLGFSKVNKRGELEDELAADVGEITFEADQPVHDFSKDSVSDWLPATALLLAYSIGHVGIGIATTKLILQGWGTQPWGVEISLGVVAALAAGLVYENTLLAGGRFIGQTPLLQSLSAYRYLAHSFAPALAFVGAEMAARSGVDWADNLVCKGGIALALALAIGGSFVESWFLLETKPMYRFGILNYGYKNPTFSKIVPVITATVLLLIVGVAASKTDAAVWPLAAGPAVAFVLSAIPSSKVPTWLAGNFGEVVLLASLAASESILRSQGL